MSLHSKVSLVTSSTEASGIAMLRQPKSLPAAARIQATLLEAERRPKLKKFLVKVTIQGSIGPVQVLMTPDSTVTDLIAAAVRIYVKECRRPLLPATNPAAYDLHYSQFNLQSLKRDENLLELGSRNFYLCKRREDAETKRTSLSPSSCSKHTTGFGLPWLGFMDFLH